MLFLHAAHTHKWFTGNSPQWFIMCKRYILSPYTNHTPKSTHHTKLSTFFEFQKTLFVCFLKPFAL